MSKLRKLQKYSDRLKETENTLEQGRMRYHSLINTAGSIILVLSADHRILEWNSEAERVYGYRKDEVLGKDYFKLFIPDKVRAYIDADIKKALTGQTTVNFENAICPRSGTERILSWNVTRMSDAKGQPIGVIAVGRDVAEHKEKTEALKLTQFSVDKAADAVFWVGPKAQILYVNDAACLFLGYSREELLSMHVYDFDKNFPKAKWKSHWQELKNRGSFTFESSHCTKNGKSFPVEITVNYIEFEGREYNCAFARNITERRKAERKLEILNKHLIDVNKRLQLLSMRDYHTGLYNYHYLEDIIESEFQRSKKHVEPLSVIMIDIDYFKSVNEIYGSQFGDMILKQLARQLKKMVRIYDIVIRFAGDEFCIICPSTDDMSDALTRKILDSVNVYNFGTKACSIKLRLSIGIASFPGITVLNGMDLVNAAEKALDKAKDEGGNRIRHYKEFRGTVPKGKKTQVNIEDLNRRLNRLKKKTNRNLVEAIFAFAKTIELRDHYTGEHVERTVYYATELARRLNMSGKEVEHIKQAAILHDLGKIGISDKILLKNTRLTKKEFGIIKKHPQIAADILRPIQILHDIIPHIFYHHERWDGSGYPAGLKKDEIPLGARVIALADAYQALSSNRPYRKAYGEKKVKRIIKKGAGTQFDPNVVKVFLDILKEEEKERQRS